MLAPRIDPHVVRASLGPPAAPSSDELHLQLIDLPTALRRAGVANPMIALAEEAVRVRLAESMQARALLLPTLDAGANLRLHSGRYLSGRGTMFDANIQSLYWGFGAEARGSGTVAIPGIRLVGHLGDAVFAPRAARQKVVESRADAAATHQYILRDVGVRYLALVEAQVRLAAYGQSLRDFEEIERITLTFKEKGQGRDADYRRAHAETLLLQAEAQQAQEALGVAAADLARLLDLDTAEPLRAADLTPPIVELVDPSLPLDALLAEAMTAHPEIIARAAEVAFQETRLRQERARPWLPVIAVGFSAGQFGGSGENTVSRLSPYFPRTDLDVAAIWSLPGLGVGSHAMQNVVRAELQMAQVGLAALYDRIRREVVEAQSLVETRRQEMALARKRVESSTAGYQQELNRAKNVLGRPLEVLLSANQLSAARQDLVRAMVGYSQAQLALFAALGNAP